MRPVFRMRGVLDDLYYYPGKLGVVFHHGEGRGWSDWPDDESFAVKLEGWAPTAQSVSLEIFDHEKLIRILPPFCRCTSIMACGMQMVRLTGRATYNSTACECGFRPCLAVDNPNLTSDHRTH